MPNRFQRARDFGRSSSRLGRDQESDRDQLREDLMEILNDPNSDLADLHACLASYMPEEASQLYREVAEDRRGVRGWARDRRERRRLARDFGTENMTRGPSGPEAFRPSDPKQNSESMGAADRARMAMDSIARRNPSFASFRARYPHATKIEKF